MIAGRSKRRARGIRSLAVCLGLAAVAAGCGHSEPGVVPVRGKVTLNGGPWPKAGTLFFTPAGTVEGSDPSKSRPGSAPFDTDGSFTVTSFQPGDGLFPGTYQVSVECLDAPLTMANDGRSVGGKSLIPARYQSGSTSGLSVTVKPGERIANLALDVKTK